MIFSFNADEVFKIAVAIEENGRNFYEKSREPIDDSEVKKLFEELARQEVEHKKKFETLRANLPARSASSAVWDPGNDQDRYIKMMADQHVFMSNESVEALLSRIKDVKDALRMAIELEKDSVIFFLTMREETDERKGQDLVSLLVKEEQSHLRQLSLELAKRSR